MPAQDTKIRILLITRNLPPLIGGMERLMLHAATGMAEYAHITVIGPSGCAEHLPANIDVFEVSEKPASFLLLSTLRSIRECRKQQFDIVMGGSGLIAPTLLLLARVFNRKVLVYLHGLDIVVDNVFYQRIFIPSIRRLDRVITNSRNTQALAIAKGVATERIDIVNPGTHIPDIPGTEVLARFRQNQQINFEKIIIFVGRMTQRKGLSKFIARCLSDILAAEPEAGLVIVGKNPEHSLNQMGEEKEVLTAVSELRQKERVLFLGEVTDDDLEACYAIADVQVFPIVDTPGDVEGFGMVAIEAAALGTPTVAFDVGGVADAIGEGSGTLITKEQYDEFATAVIEILRRKQPDSRSCRDHAQRFSWENFHTQIRSSIQKLHTDL